MIKFPFMIYDLRTWNESDVENFLEKSSSLFDAEKVMTHPFRFSLIINKDQYELVKDVNASIIVDTMEKEFYQNILMPFNKVIDNEEFLEELNLNEVYWELEKDDYVNFMDNIERMFDFIKNAETVNFIVTLDNEIDYKKLRAKSLTDFIKIFQRIQTINPRLDRKNIRILFKLDDSVENEEQIKIISELTNVSGVILTEKLAKELFDKSEEMYEEEVITDEVEQVVSEFSETSENGNDLEDYTEYIEEEEIEGE